MVALSVVDARVVAAVAVVRVLGVRHGMDMKPSVAKAEGRAWQGMDWIGDESPRVL